MLEFILFLLRSLITPDDILAAKLKKNPQHLLFCLFAIWGMGWGGLIWHENACCIHRLFLDRRWLKCPCDLVSHWHGSLLKLWRRPNFAAKGPKIIGYSRWCSCLKQQPPPPKKKNLKKFRNQANDKPVKPSCFMSLIREVILPDAQVVSLLNAKPQLGHWVWRCEKVRKANWVFDVLPHVVF